MWYRESREWIWLMHERHFWRAEWTGRHAVLSNRLTTWNIWLYLFRFWDHWSTTEVTCKGEYVNGNFDTRERRIRQFIYPFSSRSRGPFPIFISFIVCLGFFLEKKNKAFHDRRRLRRRRNDVRSISIPIIPLLCSSYNYHRNDLIRTLTLWQTIMNVICSFVKTQPSMKLPR